MEGKKEIIKEKVEKRDTGPEHISGEKIITREEVSAPTERQRQSAALQRTYLTIYYIFGIIDILLIFRFVLKILGANPDSGFVSLIYVLSAPFEYPFHNIFPSFATSGVSIASVFETSTLIAIIVYPVVAWMIARIIEIASVGKPPPQA